MCIRENISKNLKLSRLKKFKSLDGGGLEADIIYKKEKIAEVLDQGKGGGYMFFPTNVTAYRSLLAEIKEIPDEYDAEYDMDFEVDLGTFVDEAVSAHDIRKDRNKGVLVKMPAGYSVIGFKTSLTTTVNKWSNGLDAIQKIYDEQISKNKTVLNEEHLASIGVKTQTKTP